MAESHTFTPTARDQQIAWFAALGVAIHILEAALPSPLPGVKPGLANVITLIVLVQYGWQTAAWVAGLRVLVGSLLVGSFMTPTFMLSASGAIASMLVLGVAHLLNRHLPGAGIGVIGLSLLAAITHMSMQLVAAYALFIPHSGLFNLAPVLLTAACVFGIVSGLIAQRILRELSAH